MTYDIAITDEELETFEDVQQPSVIKAEAIQSLKQEQSYQFIGYTEDGLAIYSI